eukprot:EG_transcript_3801
MAARGKGKKAAAEADDAALDAMLQQFQQQKVKVQEVKITPNAAPPTPRLNACFVADPVREGQVLLFGGEYYNGDKTFCYNDTYAFHGPSGSWTHVADPAAPPPRCSHQAVAYGQWLYLYGGEYTSPNQQKFHHYGDTWRLDCKTGRWEELKLKAAPKGRSGHRMAVWKDVACMFGGFQDATGDAPKYLNDFYLLEGLGGTAPKWRKVGPVPGEARPAPRSGTCLAVHEEVLFLFGGYSAGHGPWNDLWAHYLSSGFWRSLQTTGVPPSVRSGMASAAWQGRLYLFGGVTDTDTAKAKGSTFHDELFVLNLAERRWLVLSEVLSTTAKAQAGDAGRPPNGPCARMNAMLAVQDSKLYLYGGTWEERRREWTATDFFALPLGPPSEWKCLQTMDRSAQQWLGEVDDSSEDEGEEPEDDDEEEEEEEGEGCFGDQFEAPMVVPARLADKEPGSIRAAHRHLLPAAGDGSVAAAYRGALAKVLAPGAVVLAVPGGAGLLAMLAAKAGASRVMALEGRQDVAEVARKVVASNRLKETVSVYHSELSDVDVASFPQRPTTLLSDLFGPLLLGEGLLHAAADARTRLLQPPATVVPARGRQLATLIQSPPLHRLTAAGDVEGLALGALNELQNTAAPLHTVDLGFSFNHLPHDALSESVAILDVNFQKDDPAEVRHESRHLISVQRAGVVHAILLTWEVSLDAEGQFLVSTHPTAGGDPWGRDARWGQAFQLVEETPGATLPRSFAVRDGEVVALIARWSSDLKTVQVTLERTC